MSTNPVPKTEQKSRQNTPADKVAPTPAAPPKVPKEPFFKTLPGILTGIAAVLTALGGLVTGLAGAGILSTNKGDLSIAETGLYVVRTVPENHVTDIDPDIDEIIIEFNAPLKQDSYSFVISELGTTPQFVGDPWFPEDNICSIPVSLEPGTTYALGINDAEHTNFISAEDESISADPYVLVFSTE